MDITELFQRKVNCSSEELIESAKGDIAEIIDAFQNLGFDETRFTSVIVPLTSLSVVCDGEISPAELAFFREIFADDDISMEEFESAVKATASVDAISEVKKFMDNVSTQTKAAMLDYCLNICAIDGTITQEEQTLFAIFLD